MRKSINGVRRKLDLIKQFYNVYLKESKKRPKMCGSVAQLEANWKLLDNIYFVLNNITENKNYFRWGEFLLEKDFGSASFDTRAKEWNIKDPYSELVKLRNEYERWREKRRKMKKFKKSIVFLDYPKGFNPKGFWFEK